MKQFLKIEEVAELLDMDYKSVYRLVLSGRLPAAKIGAVYRIRQDDLDRFLESQRILPGTEGSSAAVAGVASCARCGLAFRVPSLVAGKCEELGCDAPLCTSCWERAADRFCSDHARPGRLQTMERARELYRKGEIPIFLEADAARQRELTFISRFDQKLRGLPGLASPWDGSWVPVKDWATIHREEPALLLAEGVVVVRYGRGRRPLPRNISSFYYIGAEAGRKVSFAISAAFFAHIATYQEQAFDTAPVSRAELLQIIDNALSLVRSRGTRLMIGLASPTGWEPEAEEFITGSATQQAFSHEDLALCLVDLFRGRPPIYHAGEGRIGGYRHLFAGETDMEKGERVRNFLQKEVITGERLGIMAREIEEALGVERVVVEGVFSALARQGLGRVEGGPEGFLFLKNIKTG